MPVEYSQKVLEPLRLMFAKGYTTKAASKALGVSTRTLEQWSAKHPEVLAAIRAGRDTFDSKFAETALSKRMIGYEYVERSKEVIVDKHGNRSVRKRSVIKHVPPDPGSLRFYLSNRMPERWRQMSVDPARDFGVTIKAELPEPLMALFNSVLGDQAPQAVDVVEAAVQQIEGPEDASDEGSGA